MKADRRRVERRLSSGFFAAGGACRPTGQQGRMAVSGHSCRGTKRPRQPSNPRGGTDHDAPQSIRNSGVDLRRLRRTARGRCGEHERRHQGGGSDLLQRGAADPAEELSGLPSTRRRQPRRHGRSDDVHELRRDAPVGEVDRTEGDHARDAAVARLARAGRGIRQSARPHGHRDRHADSLGDRGRSRRQRRGRAARSRMAAVGVADR